MVSLGEKTSWSPKPAVRSMYEALNSLIVPVDVGSVDLGVLDAKGLDGEITGVFQVARPSELSEFRAHIGHVERLLHGTNTSSVIGILSR